MKNKDEAFLGYLVEACIDRFGFNKFRNIVTHYFDPPLRCGANGLQSAIKNIPKQIKNNSDEIKKLESIFINNMLFSEKAVQFFPVSDEVMSLVKKAFLSLEIEEKVFNKSYPFPASREILDKIQKDSRGKSFLVSLESKGNDIMLITCSVRHFTQQTDLTNTLYSDDIPELFKEFNEVFGKRHIYRQFYDLIILRPDRGMIEIAVDIPDTSSQGQTKKQQDDAFKVARSHLNYITDKYLEGTEGIPSLPIDLFPAINPIVRDKSQGKLRLLYFATDEALNNHAFAEKSERYKDLRNDTVIKDGTKNIPYFPFKCGISWPRKDPLWQFDVSPRLDLKGSKTAIELYEGKPNRFSHLKQAIITNSVTSDDYIHACEKLFEYLDYDYEERSNR